MAIGLKQVLDCRVHPSKMSGGNILPGVVAVGPLNKGLNKGLKRVSMRVSIGSQSGLNRVSIGSQ